MNNLIGKKIDHYEIQALLGEGGMGSVYRAYDLNLQRPVALKVMLAQLASQQEFQARFMQEARSAARLTHPSIVTVHYFGVSQDVLFMVMAFISGGSLNAHLRQLQENSQVVQLREVLLFLAQVADALGYAHRQGVIHRDIKPSNVLIQRVETSEAEAGEAFRAVVTDFGLAKLLSGGVETRTDTLLGTYPYMSPEMCLQLPIDGRSDIYSLGVMLYQLTTGKMPIDIRSATDAVLKHHLKTKPVPPRRAWPGLPVAVEEIINKAITHSPEDRYQTGEAVALALRQAAKSLLDGDVTKFASQRTVMSLGTRLATSEQPSEPSRVKDELPSTGSDDHLVIAQKEHTPLSLPLGKTQLIIGRSKENDIVLDHPDVSRQHARLEQTPEGWQITDLGSTNGTYIDATRLLPAIPEILTPGKSFRIGPYFLYWKLSRSQPATRIQLHSSTMGASGLKSASGQIIANARPPKLEIMPGTHAQVQMELFNASDLVDHFKLSLSDFPAAWVSISKDVAELSPGTGTAVTIDLHPPEDHSAKAGLYSAKLLVSSEAVPGETLSVPIEVTVKPFERFSVELSPSQVSQGRTTRVSIKNEGNADASYSLSGRDPAEAVQFVNKQDQIKVAPGQVGVQEVQLKAKHRPLIGTPQTLPFEIQVKSASVPQPKALPGQLRVFPYLPAVILTLLGFIFMCCLLVGGLGLQKGYLVPYPPFLVNPGQAPALPSTTRAPTAAPVAAKAPTVTRAATAKQAPPAVTEPPTLAPTITLTETATQAPTIIDQKYLALGGANGLLGSPVGPETSIAGGGSYRDFQGGSIYWSPNTGAYEIQGSIREHWLEIGGVNVLGYPVTDESTTPDGIGRYNHFQGGSIYWTPDTGAHEVQGAIREEWKSLGWEKSFLGYPLTDESTTPDGIGRYNHFQGGSIYWSPNTGAHEVHGVIRDTWKSMGWEKSCLGFPTSDEQDYSGPDGQYTRPHQLLSRRGHCLGTERRCLRPLQVICLNPNKIS